MSEVPEEVAASATGQNAPWFGEFSAEDGGEVFFIFVEQSVLCSVYSLSKALFTWFSVFFNLEYSKPVQEFCLFFQEFVFGLPDNTVTKNSTYLSVTTDIQNIALH